MSNENINNSEIYFLYDAALCNPNGDPDDENRPRMDWKTSTNLVSDVRLKRYIRDYYIDKGQNIFISKVDGSHVDATNRIRGIIYNKILNCNDFKEKIIAMENPFKNTDKDKKFNNFKKIIDKDFKEENINDIFLPILTSNDILLEYIDIKLFGITLPIKSEEGKGGSMTFTGPVQFNWGYSYNKVRILESSTITSTLSGKSEKGGSIGKDWRVYYSLIGFYGVISGKRAEKTTLSDKEVINLDSDIPKALLTQGNTTHTKSNQKPRIYIRIEYNDSETYIGDIRYLIDFKTINGKKEEDVKNVNHYLLDFLKFSNKIKLYEGKIKKIHYWMDEDIKCKNLNFNGLNKEEISL